MTDDGWQEADGVERKAYSPRLLLSLKPKVRTAPCPLSGLPVLSDPVAGVIQLVECQLPKLDVVGSSPIARSYATYGFLSSSRLLGGGESAFLDKFHVLLLDQIGPVGVFPVLTAELPAYAVANELGLPQDTGSLLLLVAPA